RAAPGLHSFPPRRSSDLLKCSGPVVINQAVFIWGRPEILERPLIVKVSAPVFVAKLSGCAPVSAKSKNTSSAIKAICRAEQTSFSLVRSSGLQKCPVGLLG